MEKTGYLVAGLVITLGAIILVLSVSVSGSSLTPDLISSPVSSPPNLHAWTKAICDKDNFCQDYFIECQDQEPLRISPITGAAIQFQNNWQDPRALEQKERLCE